MKRCAAVAALWMVGLCVCTCAQDASAPPGPDRSSGPAKGVLKFPHVQVDLAGRRILLEAELCQADYMLEFLLCTWNTKEYESLLRTKARAAHLHAGLLALGLTPGKPARWSGAGESADFLPPQGPELKIAFRWKDAQGQHELDAGRWLASPKDKTKSPPTKWIFVGSEVLPDGRYWADLPEEGGIISVGNVASAVIDVPFQSATALELREFVPETKLVPKAGTAVEVVITPMPGAQKAEHARVMVEIDRFGQICLEGRQFDPEALRRWAGEYLAVHAKGQVVIRADGRALVDDVRRARRALEIAGVEEIEELYLPPPAPILPRTPQQAKDALDLLRRQLTEPEQFLTDPVQDAEEMLKQIDRDSRELKALQALWADYAEALRKALAEYQAATRPAKQAAEEK